MKRYAVFVMRFALATMISGTFVVSTTGRESPIEWAHIVLGFVTIYLIIGLLMRSTNYPELRAPGALALVLALLEAIPGTPRLHAAISPLLFTALAWAALARPHGTAGVTRGKRQIFILPLLVIGAIFYGVGYRHATSGFVPHLGMALLAAGLLLGVCVAMNQNHPDDAVLCGAAKLTIAALLFQIVAGVAAFVIRVLDMDGGLALGLARTAHISGAALVLAAATMLALEYSCGATKGAAENPESLPRRIVSGS
ncbi:MAG TPA: hypothetical protein VN519_16755 [Bryobacteraceae bacterium]|nr:hypothetical protein [Bryobacteraceae bacterium]